MVEPGFIFEPSQPDPGLPPGVFDPTTTGEERVAQRAPETQEAIQSVFRPRDEADVTITQPQLAPAPVPPLTVQVVSPETLADTNVIKATAKAEADIFTVRPRDEPPLALEATLVDGEIMLLGGVLGQTGVAAASSFGDVLALGITDPSAQKEPGFFEKSAEFFNVDPEKAKTALGSALVIAGVIIFAPFVITSIGRLIGAGRGAAKAAKG